LNKILLDEFLEALVKCRLHLVCDTAV